MEARGGPALGALAFVMLTLELSVAVALDVPHLLQFYDSTLQLYHRALQCWYSAWPRRR